MKWSNLVATLRFIQVSHHHALCCFGIKFSSFFVRHMNKDMALEDFEMLNVWFLLVPIFKGVTVSTGRCSVLDIDCTLNS